MKNVKAELEAYLEDAYFRPISAQKRHGIDVSRKEEVIENLRDFLEAIPYYIEVENRQFEAVQRWIDTELGHVESPFQFSRETEISILTYINSCYASRRM